MHEFSIMNSVVTSALAELERYRVLRVDEVALEVGELTFLQEEQMRFAYGVLTGENMLKDSKLVIRFIRPEVRCGECGYEGRISYKESGEQYFQVPLIVCPGCGGKVEITRGRECMVRDIKAVVEDEENDVLSDCAPVEYS